MKNDPKVCMLTGYFHPIIGGTEIASLRLSKKLISKGINVYAYALD